MFPKVFLGTPLQFGDDVANSDLPPEKKYRILFLITLTAFLDRIVWLIVIGKIAEIFEKILT